MFTDPLTNEDELRTVDNSLKFLIKLIDFFIGTYKIKLQYSKLN